MRAVQKWALGLILLATGPSFATSNLAAALQLRVQQRMSFGHAQAGFASTKILAASSGGKLQARNGPSREEGQISTIGTSIILSNGGHNLSVSHFTFGGNLNNSGIFRFSRKGKKGNLRIGGTLTIPADATAGTYNGNLTVRLVTDDDDSESAEIQLPVSVKLFAVNSINVSKEMQFPVQTSNFVGNEVLAPTDSGAAEFSVSGLAGKSAKASISPSSVELTKNGQSGYISVSNFVFGGYAGAISANGLFNFPTGVGQTTASGILIGATAHYPGNLTAGDYHGTAHIRVVYH